MPTMTELQTTLRADRSAEQRSGGDGYMRERPRYCASNGNILMHGRSSTRSRFGSLKVANYLVQSATSLRTSRSASSMERPRRIAVPAIMSYQDPPQRKLFYMGINLDKRIRKNHPLRKIRELIDFDFIYKEVEGKYGYNGNESVPPPVILKLMLLLGLYNVRSERELMDTLSERLDWLWFLGFDLDTEIPNHSVLSKARRRWGEEAFRSFYERVVWQCVESGLVDGRKIFVDSSLIQADASNNSVVDTKSLKRYLNESYRELEKRLEEEREDEEGDDEDDER